ncbi:exported hypothetical protein [Bradyrhizobium sp. STM 3843]|uniref:hypothetical protein n=1 Tax=Bradyrhizobium sp. STM 3843 TaxID=551947 RepID=UPI0002407799|nr:hypothetical protein [Bradyrhizobium sp. STM 3843]CCE07354.1 exported hypothetical protein [Bradyrhizobium sp. STM 3843]
MNFAMLNRSYGDWSLAVRVLGLVAVTVLLAAGPGSAETQNKLFRHAYSCPERGKSSVCLFGTLPKATQVTVLAKNWKSSGMPKEAFKNTESDNGYETITRIQLAQEPPKDAFLIVVLVAPGTVSGIPLREVEDEALVGRIGAYVKTAKHLNLDPDIQILKTRLFRISPTILLSETFAAAPNDAAALKGELPTGCRDCDSVPLLVGDTLIDLFAAVRSHEINALESICGGIRFAFALSGRPHLVSYASSCGGDSLSATLVHDLSGKRPKLVFQ